MARVGISDKAKGQLLRFRDYLPLEMADNVLAILEALPEERMQRSITVFPGVSLPKWYAGTPRPQVSIPKWS